MMFEFKKAKTLNFSVDVTFKWKCPDCSSVYTEKWSASPYNAVAEDGSDVMCKKCDEFYKLTFYDDDDDDN